jgi:hypothetical protein
MTVGDDFGGVAEVGFGGVPFESLDAPPADAPTSDPTDPTDPGDLNTSLSDAENIGFQGSSDVGADLTGDGLQVGDAAQGLEDLAEGNYDGALGQGGSVLLNLGIGAASSDLPGINGAGAVIGDLIDGNYGNLYGDTEKAGIETGMSIALGAAGTALLGPAGTFIGSAVGDFVGDAVAPAVEDGVSDTLNTGEDIFGDTTSAFENAGSDVESGDLLGAVGDVAIGAADDGGDLLEGAYNLTGDGLEAVGDLGTQTFDLGEDLADDAGEGAEYAGEGVEDAASAVGDAASDVASTVGDGVEDAADDVGDALSDLGDDIEDLF